MKPWLCIAVLMGVGATAVGCGRADEVRRPPDRAAEQRAIQIATDAASSQGIDPDRYTVTATFEDGVWHAYFQERDSGGVLGWPAHFTILVFDDGRTRLFKGR